MNVCARGRTRLDMTTLERERTGEAQGPSVMMASSRESTKAQEGAPSTQSRSDSATHPALQSSVQNPQPDTAMEHRLARPPGCREDVKASTWIYAAWALVSARMSNADEAVFAIEECGPTTRSTAMRVKTTRDQTIADFLRAVKQQDAGALPLEESGAQRLDQRAMRTLLVVRPPTEASIAKPDGHGPAPGSRALTLELWPRADDMSAKASFDSRVTPAWIMRKALQRLELAMQQLAALKPRDRLADVRSVTSQDLAEIWEANGSVPASVERCVHDIFEERARRQPTAPAVCAWDGRLTYAQLDALAETLARTLVDGGVAPCGQPVIPLCFDKSLWTTVAVLGVLKAGRAFLLLDPAFPKKRLRLMVRRVGASFLLSSVAARPPKPLVAHVRELHVRQHRDAQVHRDRASERGLGPPPPGRRHGPDRGLEGARLCLVQLHHRHQQPLRRPRRRRLSVCPQRGGPQEQASPGHPLARGELDRPQPPR